MFKALFYFHNKTCRNGLRYVSLLPLRKARTSGIL